MDAAYRPEDWHDLYLMVGGAAAALTGLIFVAVALHLRPVIETPGHRAAAESSLVALMSIVLISGAVLIPAQPLPLLGLEVALIALANPIRSAIGFARAPAAIRRRILPDIGMGWIAGGLAVAAGVSLAIQAGGGLWLLLPGGAVGLASSVVNAWRLMVGVAEAS